MPSFLLQGVGRRYAHVVLRKADIDLSKRAGELTEDEVSVSLSVEQLMLKSNEVYSSFK